MNSQLMDILQSDSPIVEKQRLLDELSDKSLVGVCLSGVDLSGLWLVDLDLEYIDMEGAICTSTTFGRLHACSLNEIIAIEARFPWLNECSLRNADLARAYVGGVITNCDFGSANLACAILGPVPPAHWLKVYGNTFVGARLRCLSACGAQFADASLYQADLTNARLSRASFRGSNLQGALLRGANLIRADLSDSDLARADLADCLVEERSGIDSPIVRVVRMNIGFPEVVRLEQAMEDSRYCRIQWIAECPTCGRSERVMLLKSDGAIHGYAFTHGPREEVRLYTTDEPGSLVRILQDMRADYADWNIDVEGVGVDWEGPGDINALARGVLADAFAYDNLP